MSVPTGKVFLVGAGPGDPDLLTVRALRLLQQADVVLHDDLVPSAVVAKIGAQAIVHSVGKRCGMARITQQGIHDLMLDAAQHGLTVVRLKSGDPMVFGRAAEELQALREAGIPCEVVPGVSAVFAAAAAMQVPMTDRRSASKLILIAGQHAADKTTRPPLWSGTMPADATLAIYMPGRDFAALAVELSSSGVPEETPVAVVSKAASPDQSISACRLKNLSALEVGAAPLIVLVGDAMEATLQDDSDRTRQLVDEAAELLAR